MKNYKGGFEQNITIEIKGNYNLNTKKNSALVRKIMFTYSLNDEKFLQY